MVVEEVDVLLIVNRYDVEVEVVVVRMVVWMEKEVVVTGIVVVKVEVAPSFDVIVIVSKNSLVEVMVE